LRIALGILLLAVAFLFAIVEIVALVDPVGIAAANDADPFGPPAPWYTHIVPIGVIAAMSWAAIRLLRRRDAPLRHGRR
jgi:hypothetical protein